MADPRLERIARLLDLADRRMRDLEARRADRTRRDRDPSDPLAPRGTPRQAATEVRRERYAEDFPVADGMEREYREHQARADAIARAFGDAAPPRLAGERLFAYRCRLLEPLKKHSPEWRTVDLHRLQADSLEVAERAILDAARREATRPTSFRPGELVERTETDATGRNITRFFGDPEACWGIFKQPSRIVTGWSTK